VKRYFIARQPILDRKLELHAYELLFRAAPGDEEAKDSDEFDADGATAEVLSIAADAGLDTLVGKHLAFVNLPQRFLADPDLLALSPRRVVLEVLEDVVFDERALQGMQRLRRRGYSLALDDFIYDETREPAMALVDMIKLDISQIERDEWPRYVGTLKSRGHQVLAEKVETRDEFEALAALGCDFFQGFFFARPALLSGARLGASKLTLLQLISRINDADTDIDTLAELVSRDVSLSVRALNYVNSAANALNKRIESVREAIVYLGRNTIRNWVTVYLMASVNDKPSEIMALALVRARFCELVATRGGAAEPGAFFTVGMFSVLDALLDAPLATILAELAITDDMRDALLHHGGSKGLALQIMLDLERGETPRLPDSIDPLIVAQLHADAIAWSVEARRDMGLD
jgi:EAL and modified HD-GYP domain-containing signal transduction protein